MGNGTTERFNQTLLNMLGTLPEYKKKSWKDHVSTMTHSYNAAVHQSTNVSPFYLMFGRHPRLAIDAFLGLPDINDFKSHSEYIEKLRERLRFAYKRASEMTRKAADATSTITTVTSGTTTFILATKSW